ncbi:MAG: hypothetical protein NVSMB21_22120 [Vulcanimicrobiaceae bacterium]
MRALLYLEARYAYHQCVAILRSPLRLAIWIPFAGSLVYLFYARSFPARGGTHVGLAAGQATAVAGLYVGLLGVTVVLSALGHVAAFRSAAEAVLFTNAGIRPLTVAIWLHGRKLATSWTRWVGTLLYAFLIFAPRQLGAAATARALLATLFAIALQMALELPVFLLARGTLRLPIACTGGALALFGLAFAAAGALGREPLLIALRLAHVDPGRATIAALDGEPFVLVVLAALLGVIVIAVRVLGDDAMPELYRASERSLRSMRERRSARPTVHFTSARTGRARRVRVPAGALALIWKDWIAFRRGRAIYRLWLAGCVFWAACGAGVALAIARYGDPTIVLTLVATTALMTLVAAPFGASLGLGADLAKPLFWLSSAPLRSRIVAWTFARAWRGAFAIALAPVVAGLLGRDVVLAIVAAPLVLATYWSLQALGVGLYALFPSPLDSRGPMMLVRTALSAAYALPAFAIAAIAAFLHGGPIVIALAISLTLAAEGWVVVVLASLRFAEHGAALATLGRAT